MAQETKSERQEKNNPQTGFLARRRGPGAEIFPSAGDLFLMNPFSLMKRMTDEMNRAFGSSGWAGATAWSPAIEVTQKGDKLAISAELPGLKPEDVKITVDDDMLILEGERNEQKEEEGEGFRRSEIRYGKFHRTIPLPDGAKPDQAQARFDNGVLRIEVPVTEQAAQRRQIPIAGSTGETGKVESGGKKAA
jgi:HSP20 family protein